MAEKSDLPFVVKLRAAIQRNASLLCVGLDPNPTHFPAHFPHPLDADALELWGRRIIEQTTDLVCCYKPNFAFYEQFGPEGLAALQRTIAAVPDHIPVLLDAKRGDIGSTAAAYAAAAFEVWRADAVTVSPYLGRDSVEPFLTYPGKMAFVLCYTSNPSAAAIQEFGGPDRLYERVAREVASWGGPDQVGLVVGATRPEALARVRRLLAGQDYWILAPGVGAQGGDLAAALAAGLNQEGLGLIVPVSRAVIYADEPRSAALRLREQINRTRARQTVMHSAQSTISHAPRISQPTNQLTNQLRALVLALHEAGCVQFGHFTLASGLTSPVYIDLRRLGSRPALLRLATEVYAELLKPLPCDCLAAVPYAALTIGTALALRLDRPLIYPRKEVKDHGTRRVVEGIFTPGQRAVIIDDLVTSGGSILAAIAALEAAGLVVSDVAVLIDRQQGGREALAARGYNLHAALTLAEILDILEAAGCLSPDQAGAARDYQQRLA